MNADTGLGNGTIVASGLQPHGSVKEPRHGRHPVTQGGVRGGNGRGVGAEQSPRLCLRIGRIKIGQEIKVRRMKEAGSIISHAVVRARDVIANFYVAMEALVEGMLPKKGSRGGGGGDRSVAVP